MKTRARALLVLAVLGVVGASAGCGDGSSGGLVTLSGDAIPFNVSPEARVPGATISLLEYPEQRMVTGGCCPNLRRGVLFCACRRSSDAS